MKRIVTLVLAMVMLLSLAAGCGKAPEDTDMPDMVATATDAPSPTPTATPEPTEEPTPTPEPAPEFINPLTGEAATEEIATQRPVAVMINNVPDAQPLHGISQASVIYEMPVEGWLTRMIALFQDYAELDVVGSVRSARPCFVEVVDSYDAIYFHAGGSDDGMNLLWSLDVNNVNATEYDGVYFYRDSWRMNNLGTEHSLMTTGEMILKAIERMEYRTEQNEGYEQTMVFAEDGTPADGEDGSHFTVWYSENFKTSEFTYDEDAGAYAMHQWGEDLYDANTDEQVFFENVIIIVTTIYPYDGAAHQYVDFESGGEGYFFSGGKYIPITWEKPEEGAPFEYRDENGELVTFGVGSTFVCVTSDETSVIEIG